MITTYISTEAIAEHCQRRMAAFDSEPHVSMLELPLFALWLPEDLVIWLKTLVGTNLGLCCQDEEIPSFNFPSTLSSVIYPGGCPTYFNLHFHWDTSCLLRGRRRAHFSSSFTAQQGLLSCMALQLEILCYSRVMWPLPSHSGGHISLTAFDAGYPCHIAGTWHWSISLQPSCTSVSSVTSLCFYSGFQWTKISLLHWKFCPSLGLTCLFLYPHTVCFQLLSASQGMNMQREVETFVLLLMSALCLPADRAKLHLGFTVLHLWVTTPNCLIECQQTEGKDSMRSRMREIKGWSSFSFSFLYLLPSSPLWVCNSPNLEPPGCNQSHSAQPCETQVVWMKLSFWAIVWIFSVVGKVTVILGPRELSEQAHTERGGEGVRGWELLLPRAGGADGGTDCNSGGVPDLPALGLSRSSCNRENPLIQCTHCTTFTAGAQYILKEKKNHLRKIGKNFQVGLTCQILCLESFCSATIIQAK